MVRSTHASTTVRTRPGDSRENELSCSLVKQTTSQRPYPGCLGNSSEPALGATSSTVVAKDGKRFSKTTTS